MALVARSANASLESERGRFVPHVTGNLYAGAAIDAGAPCYIRASDGQVFMSNGTAANEAAKFDGFANRAYAAGEAVALFGVGAIFHYSDALLTPGQNLFIAATAGRLDDAATTGDAVGVARAINSRLIRVIRNA
jgi:hypothetical protein